MRFCETTLLSLMLIAGMMIQTSMPLYGNAEGIAETKIFVLTDIHYIAKSLHDEGTAFRRLAYEGDGKNTELIHEILEAFRFTLNRTDDGANGSPPPA